MSELLDDIVRKAGRHGAWGDDVLTRLCNTDAKRELRRRRANETRQWLEESGGVTGELGTAPAGNPSR
jgi:hypothetical protein